MPGSEIDEVAPNCHAVNDRKLIEWLQNNYSQMPFVACLGPYDTYKRREKLEAAITRLDPCDNLFAQRDTAAEIWRNLVGMAIVYLKYKDEREVYHDGEDYGVDRLHRFFEAFQGFETLLYGAEPRYRDHITHMLSVFVLGEYLVREHIGFGNIAVGDEELPNGLKVSSDEKEAMWCLISLTHDLGMALERIPTITTKVKDMMEQFGILDVQPLSCPFPLQPLHDFALRFVSADLRMLPKCGQPLYVTHIQPKYFLKFSEAYERRDHGLVSCLVLMKNLVYFLESDFLLDTHRPFEAEDAKQFLIRRTILRSIAAHNCRNIYHLTVPQFPFLLTLFDDMHEWGRPRLADMFGEKTPETEVSVELFTRSAVHYRVTMTCPNSVPDSDKERMAREAMQYFLKKCEKLKMILRSAVGGIDRKLALTFEVVDQIGKCPICYKLIHERPDKVRMTKNGEMMDLLDQAEAMPPRVASE